jgi:hypothetical protein
MKEHTTTPIQKKKQNKSKKKNSSFSLKIFTLLATKNTKVKEM